MDSLWTGGIGSRDQLGSDPSLLLTEDLYGVRDNLDSLSTQVKSITIKELRNSQHVGGEQDALDSLLGEILASYHKHTCTLSYRRNQLAPINRCPDEIVSMILLESAILFHSRSRRYFQLTRVCKRWRQIILNDAKFWTLIDYFSPVKLITKGLKLSKEAKITVKWHPRVRYMADFEGSQLNDAKALFKDILLPVSARLKVLDVAITPNTWPMILPILQQPAPALQRLSLKEPPGFYRTPALPRFEFDTPLFAGVAPLNSLCFCLWSNPPWASLEPISSTLIHLKLSLELTSMQSELQNVFCILSANLALETLLVGCTRLSESKKGTVVATNLPHVRLDRLVSIALRGQDFSVILAHLTLPNLQAFAADIPDILTIASFNLISKHCNFSDLRHLFIGEPCQLGRTRFHCTRCIWGLDMENPGGDLTCFGNDEHDPLDENDGHDFPDKNALGRRFYIRFLSNDHEHYASMEFFLSHMIIQAPCLSKFVLHCSQLDSDWGPFRTKILYKLPQVRALSIMEIDDGFIFLDLLSDPALCPDLVWLECVKGSYAKKVKRQIGKPIIDCIKLRLSRDGGTKLEQIRLKGYPPVANLWVNQLANWGIEIHSI